MVTDRIIWTRVAAGFDEVAAKRRREASMLSWIAPAKDGSPVQVMSPEAAIKLRLADTYAGIAADIRRQLEETATEVSP